MNRVRIENLRRLIDESTSDAATRRAAARELAGLLAQLSVPPDPRRLATLERARRARQLIDQGVGLDAVASRLRRSRSQVNRLLRLTHESCVEFPVEGFQQSPEDPMPDLRKVSLGLSGSQPANLPTIPRSRPTTPKVETPRDGGSMSDGSTGGNFDLATMTRLPNNAGPKGTESGIDAANAAQEANK